MSELLNDIRTHCPICQESIWFDARHTCDPQWNVWTTEEAGEESTEEFRLVYASNAEDAAEKVARQMSDDGPFEGELTVREWLGSEEEQGPSLTFSIEPEMVLRFNISHKL
jgi:hypothetical protein